MVVDKPRVLILTPAFRPNLGGVESHLDDLTEYLRTHGYFTYVLTYQPITTIAAGPGFEKLPLLEIYRYSWFQGNYFNQFVGLHPVFNFLYLTPYLLLRAFIFLLFHRRQVDLIHAIGLSAAFSGLLLKVIFRKPIVMTTETLFNFIPGTAFARVAKWTLSHLDGILAQSEESKSEMLALGIPTQKITVFSHWVNQDALKPVPSKSAAKKKLGWKTKFTLLYVGRLIPEKGIRLTVATAKELGGDFQLQIIGSEGPELDFVKKAAEENTNIEFLGKFSHSDLAPYYAAADVLVYPALYQEDMAYVLLDSLSCGTPVISTNPGSGIYHLPQNCAFVVAPTVEAIGEKVKYLSSHPAQAQAMSRAAVKFASRFGPTLAKTITRLYDSLHARHRQTE